MDERTIIDILKRLRISRGYSQSELADLLGISRVSYSKLETGKTKIVSEHIYALANLYRLMPEEILLGYKPDPDTAARFEMLELDYDTAIQKLKQELYARIESKDNELAALRELVTSLKSTIRSQEEIIKMLKSRIPEENA